MPQASEPLRDAVDAHMHIWTPQTHPWLQDEAAAGRRPGHLEKGRLAHDFLQDDYRSDLQGSGLRVVKSVYVQAQWQAHGADPVGESAWVQERADADPQGLPQAIVAYADLHRPELAAEQLAAHAARPGFRGVRFMLDWHEQLPGLRQTDRPDWMRDPGFRRGVGLLERSPGMVFDLQLCQGQLLEAAAFVAAYPALTFSLNHSGFPLGGGRDAALLAKWEAGMAALARCPNLVCKAGALCNYDDVLGHGPWTAAAVGLYTRKMLQLFGPQRVLWETNLPVDRLVGDTAARVRAFLDAISHLREEEQEDVLRRNAERVYRI